MHRGHPYVPLVMKKGPLFPGQTIHDASVTGVMHCFPSQILHHRVLNVPCKRLVDHAQHHISELNGSHLSDMYSLHS